MAATVVVEHHTQPVPGPPPRAVETGQHAVGKLGSAGRSPTRCGGSGRRPARPSVPIELNPGSPADRRTGTHRPARPDPCNHQGGQADWLPPRPLRTRAACGSAKDRSQHPAPSDPATGHSGEIRSVTPAESRRPRHASTNRAVQSPGPGPARPAARSARTPPGRHGGHAASAVGRRFGLSTGPPAQRWSLHETPAARLRGALLLELTHPD